MKEAEPRQTGRRLILEFGDMQWVPLWYHIYLRRSLIFFYKLFGYYRLWVPALQDFIRRNRPSTLMEFCSGTGEALQLVAAELKGEEVQGLQFILSDVAPHGEFVEKVNGGARQRFHYVEKPVDATVAYRECRGPRVFINSFHHFTAEQAGAIIRSNQEQGNELIILEYVRHSLLGYVSMITGALSMFVGLPFFVRPKDLPLMILVTYVVPLFPAMVLWDGVVSCFRSYSVGRLAEIVRALGIDAKVSGSIRRSPLYPAGVTAIAVTYPGCRADLLWPDRAEASRGANPDAAEMGIAVAS